MSQLLLTIELFIHSCQVNGITQVATNHHIVLISFVQVYGSFVAGLYSNQQILPLSQMSVSADCFYQPRVDADFIAETDEANLGTYVRVCVYCTLVTLYSWSEDMCGTTV